MSSSFSWSASHCPPPVVSSSWISQGCGRPRATRDPALGSAYVLDPRVSSGAVIDDRSAADVIGANSRLHTRTECCVARDRSVAYHGA